MARIENSDLEATKRQFLSTYRGLVQEWAWYRDAAENAKAKALEWEQQARAHEGEMARVGNSARQMQETGLLMGFDLQTLWAEQSTEQEREPIPEPPSNDDPQDEVFVKDLVLMRLEQAYPGAVKAAEVQEYLKMLGHDVHPKTVGMSLYRWSQKAAVRRDGRDWYFVPEQDRPALLTAIAKEKDQAAVAAE